MAAPLAHGVLLVGSLPLSSTEEVFTTLGPRLGDRLRAIPDGETGERVGWILFQLPVIEQLPWVRRNDAAIPGFPEPLFRYHVDEAFLGQELALPSFGYAELAIESYEKFRHHKKSGELPDHLRFQVSLPSPYGFLVVFEPTSWTTLVSAYEEMLKREVGAIASAIPHQELTVQWDMAAEPGILEGVFPADVDEMFACAGRLVDAVPSGAEVGIHLCYGSMGNTHYMEPKDTSVSVSLANRIAAAATREVDYVHLPVPKVRSDDAYFAPLEDLQLDSGTRLYLGLVHADGEAANRTRMAAASRVVPKFGVATECGMGRFDPRVFPELMDAHIALAASDREEAR